MSYNRYGGGSGGYQERKVSIQIYLNYILIVSCLMTIQIVRMSKFFEILLRSSFRIKSSDRAAQYVFFFISKRTRLKYS